MRQAMAKAKAGGIGLATVRGSCHFGAAGYYPAMAAREGFIALAMANDIPSVSAPGARGAITGSNPFAYGVPTSTDPIVLDMASSTVAGGKVMAAHYHNKSIPLDWIKDSAGNASADPAAFFAGGSLQPMGGHKGYGIALMIEMLAGCLSGAMLTWQIKSWIEADPTLATGHGGAFIAINVESLMPIDEFKKRVDHVTKGIHDSPKAPDVKQIFLPGEIEWAKRAVALKEGIVLPPEVVATLSGLAEDLEMDLATKLPHTAVES
jgi:ureidoglycolate dehydrogenase (NAD+)